MGVRENPLRQTELKTVATQRSRVEDTPAVGSRLFVKGDQEDLFWTLGEQGICRVLCA